MLRKKDTVWYYTHKGWKRGKIHAISKYMGPWNNSDPCGLWIKPFNGRAFVHIPSSQTVVDGTLTKPTGLPVGYLNPFKDYYYALTPWYGKSSEHYEKAKLMRKVGII